jgi:DnaJ-class molecular chaperone
MPAPPLMTAYVGFWRDTEVPVRPIDRGASAGEVPCFECNGTGDWTPFHPERATLPPGSIKCRDCKGSGRVFVSI